MFSKKTILTAVIFFILGAIVAYNINKPQPNNLPTNNKADAIPEPLIDKYFPIQKGNFWEYEGIRREDVGSGKIETNNIKKRVEVVDIQETPEGKLVTLDNPETSKIFIKDNMIDFDPDWPSEDKAIWTFPLYVGEKFGNEDEIRYRDDGFYVWEVEEKLSREVLGKKYDECFRIASKGVPDTSYKVFCYGLGIVEEGYKHNGTILEWNYKLISSNIKSSSEQPDLSSKIEQVKKQGYTPYDTTTYDPNSPLNVLIGVATGSADGYNQKAFFFYGDQYLGTDTTDPSITIALAGRDDKTITLRYTLYNSSDSLANPTGGFATVRYQWDGSKLTPLDPIPSTDWSTNGHR